MHKFQDASSQSTYHFFRHTGFFGTQGWTLPWFWSPELLGDTEFVLNLMVRSARAPTDCPAMWRELWQCGEDCGGWRSTLGCRDWRMLPNINPSPYICISDAAPNFLPIEGKEGKIIKAINALSEGATG